MRGMIFCKRCGNYAADGLDACPKCNANLFESGHPSLVGGVIRASSPAAAAPKAAAGAAAGAMFGYGSEPAGHVQRFVALLIDGIIQGLILGLGFAATVVLGRDLTGVLILGAVALVVVVYEPYFIAAKGATPGKSAMHLRVVGRDGAPVSAGQSVARFLIKGILNQFFIPLFVPLFNPKHQGLHDMITSTYVVRG